MKPILIYFLISVICAFFSSFIAKEKNRNSTAWFWLGFLFNAITLLALIAIPVLPKKNGTITAKKSGPNQKSNPIPNDLMLLIKDDNNKQPDDSLNKKLDVFCHFCGETIPINESICPSCKKKIK